MEGEGTPPGPAGPEKGSTREFVRGAVERTLLVVQAFRERYAADRAAGLKVSISEYCAQFPGDEDLVREEWKRLRDEDPPVRVSAAPWEVLQDLLRRGAKEIEPSREIARGGMGIVYRLKDPLLQRDLALKYGQGARVPVDGVKTLSAGSALRRMLQEAQITAQLSHPGVVPVHEIGIDREGRLFFTMKLVRGRTLREVFALVRDGLEGWTMTRALQVLIRICETLAFAHNKGVIHRDLKPSNVMVGNFGEVYVMDWGVAKVVGDPAADDPLSLAASASEAAPEPADPAAAPLTRVGDVVGTPEYMPPEQAAGRIDAMDHRADIYSLGAMLYELLTARAPYNDPTTPRTPVEVLREVVTGPPRPVQALARHVPPELQAICDKAMAREPGDRYPTAEELANDLHRYLEHRVVRAYRTGPLVELRTWVRRNAVVAGTVAASLAVLAFAGARYAIERARDAQVVREERDGARNAEKREREAHTRAVGLLLAARAADAAARDPGLALQLAVEAAARAPGPESNDALHAALAVHQERRRLVGHDGYVVGGSWSPNGRRVLTWEWGEAAILWDADAGRVVARLLHEDTVRHAAFSPDGSRAVTSCDDDRLRLWDAADGRLLASLDARSRVHALAFVAGDPDLLATGAADGSVRLWRFLDRPGQERVLREAGAKVSGVAAAPDGRLAAVDGEGTIRIWDARSGRLLVEAAADGSSEGEAGEKRPPHAVAFLERGRVLASWVAPGTMRFHAVGEGGLRLLAEGKTASPVAVSGFGNRVATWRWEPRAGAPDDRVPVLEIREANALDAPRVVPLEKGLHRLALDWNGDRLALLAGAEVELRDARDGARYATLRGHRYDMKDAAFSVDATRLLTCSADMTARIWDSEPPDTVRVPPGVPNWSLSPDGRRRLVVEDAPGPDGRIGVAVAHMSAFVSDLTFDLPAPLDSLRWLPDGVHLLAVAGGKVILLDDAGGVKGEAPLPAGTEVKSGSQFDASGDLRRVAFRTTREVVVADFPSSSILPVKLANQPLHFALSPDGTRLLGAHGAKGTATVVEIDTGRVVHTLAGHTGFVLRVAWSPDGRLLATSAMEGRVRVWDAASGLQVAAVAPVPMKTNPVAFGDGSRWLLVEADEVMLCEAATGKRVAGLRPPAPQGTKFAFRWLEGTGSLALQWGDPARVRLYPLDPLAVAKRRLPIEMEALAVRTHELLEGDAADAYEEAWIRRHPTGRSFARKGIEAARRGRLDEAFPWVEAARILRPRLSDVAWAEALVRAKRAGGLPAGAERDGEITKSLEALSRAVAGDGNLRTHARGEPLLAALRSDPRYQALVGND